MPDSVASIAFPPEIRVCDDRTPPREERFPFREALPTVRHGRFDRASVACHDDSSGRRQDFCVNGGCRVVQDTVYKFLVKF